jgi:hypothetical protein
MLHKSLFLAVAALLVALATSSEVQAWGAAHVGYHASPYGGGYHAGYTHYGPVTGFQHYGTGGGYHYGVGGYQYGGYHYGGYGGYSAGYVRRW